MKPERLNTSWPIVQLSLLLLTTLVASVVAVWSVDAVDKLLRAKTERSAMTWASAAYANGYVRAILADGERPVSLNDESRLRELARMAKIFRYTLYEPGGQAILSSHMPRALLDRDLSAHDKGTLAQSEGVMTTDVYYDRPSAEWPDAFGHTFVPVRSRGETVLIAEVYVDKTDAQAILSAVAWRMVLAVLGLASLTVLSSLFACQQLWRQHLSSRRAHHLAQHDPLTDLYNRLGYQSRLEQALQGARKRDGAIALLTVDIDNFKTINDSLGHDAGDRLLGRVSAMLLDSTRPQDVVARVGGDEFAVIQVDVESPAQAKRLAARLNAAVRRIDEVDGVPVTIGTSIGIALAPLHADEPGELQKCADIALYRSKANGRDQFTLFCDGMDEAQRASNRMRVLLREAVQKAIFTLHYQPLHQADDGSLTSFEALLRLPDGEGGFIAPDTFLPVAEEMGLLARLGNSVIEHACRTAAGWPPSVSVSVNLSAQQFEGDIVGVVAAALEESGLEPVRLELEITEALFIRDPHRVGEKLLALKRLGVAIVMDDFGTGYSSLAFLWRFPFDKLKVDRTCFRDLDANPEQREVLRTIIAMTKSMSLRVTAEGIETRDQANFATDAGYSELQGFLYHRPMPSEDVGRYIEGVAARTGGGPVAAVHLMERTGTAS